MSEKVIHVSDEDFDKEVIQSEIPVLVDFWADWCGPCKMIAPVIEELAGEMEGELKVAKLDVDQNKGIASKFGIMSIPTMVVFNDGKAIERFVGFMPKEKLKEEIEKALT